MSAWLAFWETSLVISAVAFAFISVVVAVRGFSDLRQMMAGLSRVRSGTDDDKTQ